VREEAVMMKKFAWSEWAPFLMVLGLVLIGTAMWMSGSS
jgi:hypothetical protein